MMTPQQIDIEGDGDTHNSTVQSLKEIKKSRRTVMLGSALPVPDGNIEHAVPLTPPLSERASGDVAELFSPEREERYESIDLSSGEEETADWDHSEQQSILTEEVILENTLLKLGVNGRGQEDRETKIIFTS
jgi:hypothetical protein